MLKLFKEIKTPQTIITYSELFAESKSQYHFVKSCNANHIFVSVQHSHNCKNLGPTYSKKIEYMQKFKGDTLLSSPKPDYYLLHGLQYKEILKSFFPDNNIFIIGNLRYTSSLGTESLK